MLDPSVYLIVGLVAIGMGLSFLAADPDSPTSRALALMLGLFGLTVVTYVLENLGFLPEHPVVWARLRSIFDSGALVAGFEWVVRVGRTSTANDSWSRRGEALLRVAQGLAFVFAIVGFMLPQARAELLGHGFNTKNFARTEFYFLVVPFDLSLLLASLRVIQLLACTVENAEKIRLIAFAAAMPLFIAPLMAPAHWGPFITVAGEMIFLAGSVRYHVLQGQRGEFLARFLAPQVARLVHERGLSSTMQQNRVQLSVVACDLRGFTAFAETAAPEEVIQFLRDYYEAIGQAVTEYGGTIKDFAGDGILTLVGAPIPYSDHARRAVDMALGIRERAGKVLSRWRKLGLELGLGVGAASGFVTVGTIGSAGRLEYAAVGPAVNLAARLCDRAQAGQILVDQRTVGLIGEDAGHYRFENLDPIELKGFARAISISAVIPETAPAPALAVPT
jgi:class 3 adenylate cyclase